MNAIVRKNFIMMTIHEQLRFLRKRNRKTQEVLGGLVGVSSRSIRAYETGERLPDLGTVSMIMEILCAGSFEVASMLHAWEKAAEAREVCYRPLCKHD